MTLDNEAGIAFSLFILFYIILLVAVALTVKKAVYKKIQVRQDGSNGNSSKNKYALTVLVDAVLIYGVSNILTSFLASRIDSGITGLARSILTQPYNYVFMYVLTKSLYYGIKATPATHLFYKSALSVQDIKNFLILDAVVILFVILKPVLL